jgi:hypothetical protein
MVDKGNERNLVSFSGITKGIVKKNREVILYLWDHDTSNSLPRSWCCKQRSILMQCVSEKRFSSLMDFLCSLCYSLGADLAIKSNQCGRASAFLAATYRVPDARQISLSGSGNIKKD